MMADLMEVGLDITLKQMEILRWVVVAGSITKASQRVGLSQPSISQQLAKLEETLGTQLIVRNRTGLVSMTPSGEFWFKASQDILFRTTIILNEHEQRFKHSSVILKLGTTPALRGRFTAAAARIAQSAPGFVKFELIYDRSSAALVEQLRMHHINFAIVTEQAILADQLSFAVSKVFEDNIAWVVPASISNDDLIHALNPCSLTGKNNPLLNHYVEIHGSVLTRTSSEEWYRNYLPQATATFTTPTFASSIELVAGGLGTCHVPFSLLPNLSQSMLSAVKLFRVDGMSRTTVLVMRKHLLSHAAYAHIFHKLTHYCQNEYLEAMHEDLIPSFECLLKSAFPEGVRSAAE